MLNPTRQRRITYVLLGVCFFYLIFFFHSYYNEAINDRLRPLRTQPIKLLNNLFGLNMSTTQYFDSPPLYTPNCHELVADSQELMTKTVEFMKTYKQRLTDNEFYVKVNEDCPKFLTDYNYTEMYHQVPLKFPTAYVITAHTSVQQFNLLMHAIYNEHNVYCVHVDNSSDPVFRKAMEAVVSCLPNVFAATKSESVVLNDHSELRAEFHCLKDLLSLPTHWRYVVNLDETSFPLKSNTEMTDVLRKLGEYNMIEGIPGKINIADDRYVRYKYRHVVVGGKLVQTQTVKTLPPANIQLYYGAPYYVATRDFIQFVLSNYYAVEFYTWLNETYAPRELYWATLSQVYMRNQNIRPMSRPPPHYYKIRTRPSGEVSEEQECFGKFAKNACVFGVEALPLLHSREELFATRFDIRYDHLPLVCLDITITNPYDFNEKLESVP